MTQTSIEGGSDGARAWIGVSSTTAATSSGSGTGRGDLVGSGDRGGEWGQLDALWGRGSHVSIYGDCQYISYTSTIKYNGLFGGVESRGVYSQA